MGANPGRQGNSGYRFKLETLAKRAYQVIDPENTNFFSINTLQ
jgi:hypothetical protein